MIIGDRLRLLREEKQLSQGNIEKRTGLLRCYISRVENGHTVPAIETIEKLARALEVPMYQVFYDGDKPLELPNLPKRKSSDDIVWGSVGKDARYLITACASEFAPQPNDLGDSECFLYLQEDRRLLSSDVRWVKIARRACPLWILDPENKVPE